MLLNNSYVIKTIPLYFILLTLLTSPSFASPLKQADIHSQETIVLSYVNSMLDKDSEQEIVELLKYEQQDLNLNGKNEFIVLWQLTGASYWYVMLSVLNDQGQELDSLNLGRNANLIGIKDGDNTPLIFVENKVYRNGDIRCCPSKDQTLTLQLKENGLHTLKIVSDD